MSLFKEAFNRSYEDAPTLTHEYIHLEREGCVEASGSSPFDNYSILAPFFAYDSKVQRSIFFGNKFYAHTQTLNTTFRDGFSVHGGSGGSGPWSKQNYDVDGALPAAEFGGPGGGLIWTGTPGGTMVRGCGTFGIWEGVNLQGLYHPTNGSLVKESIDFSDAAGICFELMTGDQDLGGSPPVKNPGRWGFFNCNAQSASVGFKLGNTYSGNHADHCFLYNVGLYALEDAIWIAGTQSLQHHITPQIGLIKRFIRLSGGGHLTVNNPWIGAGYGNTTLIHVTKADFNGGNLVFHNTQLDATLAGNAKVINYSAINIGSGANDSAFFSASAAGNGDTYLKARFYGGNIQFGVTSTPLFRLKGFMRIDLHDWFGLYANSFEVEHISVNWADLGTIVASPTIRLNGGQVRKNVALTNDPGEGMIYESTSQEYILKWRDYTWDIGGEIFDGIVNTRSDQ